MLAHTMNTNNIVSTGVRDRQTHGDGACKCVFVHETDRAREKERIAKKPVLHMQIITQKRAHFQPEIGYTCPFKYC